MIVKSFNDFLSEKKNFELVQKDGEWAIFDTTKNAVTLYGPKEDLEKVMSSLSEGVINEDLKVVPVGLKGGEYHITINGHEYGYKAKSGSELTIQEIGEKFVKILKYSAGRAITWLKKNTDLASGSKKNESEDIAIFNFLHEEIDRNDSGVKLFETFVSEAKKNDEPDIEDMAVDMLDFYGGEVPQTSPTEYAKVRDIHDKELLDQIHGKALEFYEETMREGVDWESVMKKPAKDIHDDLKKNLYTAQSFRDYEKSGAKIDAKQKEEFEKALKTFDEDQKKEKEKTQEEAKSNRQKADILNKIEKLEKEKVKPTTEKERIEKINSELEKLNKKIKALDA
jgi:hypothetical protein